MFVFLGNAFNSKNVGRNQFVGKYSHTVLYHSQANRFILKMLASLVENTGYSTLQKLAICL